MKKFLSVLLICTMVLGLCACTGNGSKGSANGFKAGFIFLHDENSTYDLNFITGAKQACEKLGVEAIIKTNIPEGQECYDAACELADQGCG